MNEQIKSPLSPTQCVLAIKCVEETVIGPIPSLHSVEIRDKFWIKDKLRADNVLMNLFCYDEQYLYPPFFFLNLAFCAICHVLT